MKDEDGFRERSFESPKCMQSFYENCLIDDTNYYIYH